MMRSSLQPSKQPFDIFEQQYEPNLRLSTRMKAKLIDQGWAVYVYRDGIAVGESYGAPPDVIRKLLGADDIGYADCEQYCYGTTVLPEYRGQGIGLELAALSLIVTFPQTLCGHATSPAMALIRDRLGAEFPLPPEKNYAGTSRTALYYEHRRDHADTQEECLEVQEESADEGGDA